MKNFWWCFFLPFQHHNNNNNRSRKTRCAKLKKKRVFLLLLFFFSFQGRLSCRLPWNNSPRLRWIATLKFDVTDDDGEYLFMSSLPHEISKTINVPAVSVVNQNPIHVERSDGFSFSRRFSAINGQHFWLFEKEGISFFFQLCKIETAQKGNTTHAGSAQWKQTDFSSSFLREEHTQNAGIYYKYIYIYLFIWKKESMCVVGWSYQRRLSCLDEKMFRRTPSLFFSLLHDHHSLVSPSKSLFFFFFFFFYFIFYSVCLRLFYSLPVWRTVGMKQKREHKKKTDWMNGIVKEEKSDETWEKEGDKKWERKWFEKEPGKMFSSLFSFFSHFPLWAAEPEQSLQLNHTDGISSKKFFLKKGRRKRNEPDHTTRPRKNPVFSLHITTMNFVS